MINADFAGIGAPTAAESGLVLTNRIGQNAIGSLLRFFEETGIEIVPFYRSSLTARDRRLRPIRQGRHPAALNFGDCMTYAFRKTDSCLTARVSSSTTT